MANRETARALYEGRSDAQLLWRPEPGAWSITECLLHLNQSGRIYLGSLDQAIEEGTRRGRTGAGPYRHPWFSRWFVASLDAPAKHRMKAPRIFLPPAPTDPPRETLREFEELGEAIARRLDASTGLDLGRVRVVSPVTSLVRLSLGMGFAMLAAHERRHLDQAWRLAAHPDFPADV